MFNFLQNNLVTYQRSLWFLIFTTLFCSNNETYYLKVQYLLTFVHNVMQLLQTNNSSEIRSPDQMKNSPASQLLKYFQLILVHQVIHF